MPQASPKHPSKGDLKRQIIAILNKPEYVGLIHPIAVDLMLNLGIRSATDLSYYARELRSEGQKIPALSKLAKELQREACIVISRLDQLTACPKDPSSSFFSEGEGGD
jgi:hypothetical protein